MPTVSQIIKIRQEKRLRQHQSPLGRLGITSAFLISVMMVALLGAGIWYSIDLTRDLPDIATLPALLEPPDGALLQPSKLYDRQHEHVILTLQYPSGEGQTYLQVSGEQTGMNLFPQHLIDATISALDPGFWQEWGFSWARISDDQSPTIAERLVSILLVDDEPASTKKEIQERLLAWQITQRYGRQKVMEWYLNSAMYGDFVYGADEAARVYFGKPATQLSIAEAAMLTAISALPGMNPWTTGQPLKDRQEQVIQAMRDNGMISEVESQNASVENIVFQPQQALWSLAPEFSDQVLFQLASRLPLERIYRGGYEIITTLNYDLQLQAACASQVHMDHLQGRKPQQVTEIGTPCEAASLLSNNEEIIERPLQRATTSVIILDPQVGEILAWVGGEQGIPSPTPPTRYPADNILSPFLYLTAFARGMSPANLVWDLPLQNIVEILPENLASYHGPVRLRTAMINDYSTAAEEVLQQAEIENVWSTMQKFGISIDPNETVISPTITTLHNQPISLLESTQAYGVLADQGLMTGQNLQNQNNQSRLSPGAILSVSGVDGKPISDWTNTQVQPIVSPGLAYLATNVLSDEKARPADLRSIFNIGRPAGIKTSLSAKSDNSWEIGYIPQLVVGVHMGSSSGDLTADMVSSLWQAVMKYSTKAIPTLEFAVPDDITRVEVCDPSGLLVTPACPSTVEEVFLKGNEPTEVDNLYQSLWINKDTGLLATIFTPSEQVERKTFLVLPQPTKDWEMAVGLPIAPDAYDEIDPFLVVSKNAAFSIPQMNSYVSGKIDFYGSAIGDDFSYYRLQVGQGFYPQQWIQVGEDNDQPVSGGYLGSWDTSGLDGVYVVELLVVMHDMRVERAYLLVNVDNTPPELQILTPIANQQFSQQIHENIVIDLEVFDNQVIQRVDFYVDDQKLSTLYEPPFIISIPSQLGLHSVQVIVYDLAGNRIEASTSFTVIK